MRHDDGDSYARQVRHSCYLRSEPNLIHNFFRTLISLRESYYIYYSIVRVIIMTFLSPTNSTLTLPDLLVLKTLLGDAESTTKGISLNRGLENCRPRASLSMATYRDTFNTLQY
jgi:hypothetical protein